MVLAGDESHIGVSVVILIVMSIFQMSSSIFIRVEQTTPHPEDMKRCASSLSSVPKFNLTRHLLISGHLSTTTYLTLNTIVIGEPEVTIERPGLFEGPGLTLVSTPRSGVHMTSSLLAGKAPEATLPEELGVSAPPPTPEGSSWVTTTTFEPLTPTWYITNSPPTPLTVHTPTDSTGSLQTEGATHSSETDGRRKPSEPHVHSSTRTQRSISYRPEMHGMFLPPRGRNRFTNPKSPMLFPYPKLDTQTPKSLDPQSTKPAVILTPPKPQVLTPVFPARPRQGPRRSSRPIIQTPGKPVPSKQPFTRTLAMPGTKSPEDTDTYITENMVAENSESPLVKTPKPWTQTPTKTAVAIQTLPMATKMPSSKPATEFFNHPLPQTTEKPSTNSTTEVFTQPSPLTTVVPSTESTTQPLLLTTTLKEPTILRFRQPTNITSLPHTKPLTVQLTTASSPTQSVSHTLPQTTAVPIQLSAKHPSRAEHGAPIHPTPIQPLLKEQEKELQDLLRVHIPPLLTPDIARALNMSYRRRVNFANHEMVDKILQQEPVESELPPGECPIRYFGRRINLLRRVLGLLILALPQSLKELEDAAWDDELENLFFRPGEKNILDVPDCRQCYVKDYLGRCREIFFCKSGSSAGFRTGLTTSTDSTDLDYILALG